MMIAKTGSTHSKYAGLLPIEPSDDFFRPIDLIPEPIDYPEDVPFPHGQPSAGKRPRSLARFSIAFCMGVAVTLLWQSSYGDAVRESITKLYPRVGWLAARLPTTAENVIAPASPSADQLNAFDLDAMGRNVEKISTPIAPAQEPATRSTDQTTTAQEQIIGNTDQTAISVDQAQASKDGQGDASSLQPAARLGEAKAPQTLSEKRKPLSAASVHDPSCFPSASAVLHNNSGGWATWTLRARGHEGTMCWYAAARHRVSDHRSMGSGYRREMLPEEIETLGTAESGLYAPFVPHGRGGSWEGGLP